MLLGAVTHLVSDLTFFCRCRGVREQTYLVHWVDDPVNSAVLADGFVRRVHKDDLEVLVCAVLVDPVRVQDAQVGASSTDSFFSGGAQRALVLELVDTLVGRLT